nr:DUF3883 domain-containing protein [Gemmatimonadota bacterium]
GVVTDGTGAAAGRRVFCLLQRPDGEVEPMNPSVLWDLEPQPDAQLPPHLAGLLADRASIEDHIVEHVLLPYRDEIAERRDHDARIKERYGLRSLEYLLQESNQKLLDYDLRAAAGENMDIAIRNELRNREQLERRRDDLQTEIRLERNLTIAEPQILGAAAVLAAPVPAPGVEAVPVGRERQQEDNRYGDGMRRDDEIELVGMRVAIEYEEAEGWRPEDVSKEKHGGFDIRSILLNADGSIGGARYVEVKARARSGEIRLTANEWKKARHFGPNYWIYVVTEAGTDSPTLTRIANPAARFREDEDIFAAGFVIPEDRWRQHASEIDEETIP